MPPGLFGGGRHFERIGIWWNGRGLRGDLGEII